MGTAMPATRSSGVGRTVFVSGAGGRSSHVMPRPEAIATTAIAA